MCMYAPACTCPRPYTSLFISYSVILTRCTFSRCVCLSGPARARGFLALLIPARPRANLYLISSFRTLYVNSSTPAYVYIYRYATGGNSEYTIYSICILTRARTVAGEKRKKERRGTQRAKKEESPEERTQPATGEYRPFYSPSSLSLSLSGLSKWSVEELCQHELREREREGVKCASAFFSFESRNYKGSAAGLICPNERAMDYGGVRVYMWALGERDAEGVREGGDELAVPSVLPLRQGCNSG